MIRTHVMRTLLTFLIALTTISIAATPHVSSITPSNGPVSGGTYVHVGGSDLTGFALACPSIDCSNYVQFGGVIGTLAAADDSEMVAVAPPHAAGAVDVVVNVAGKAKITIPNGFRYEETPADESVRLMIPIVIEANAPGAFGSSWHSDVTMHNASNVAVLPQAPTCNPYILAPCLQFRIEAHQTVHPTLYPNPGDPAVFVRIPRSVADAFDVQARVQDVSRQAQTWGTSIPVVRPTDFRPVVRLHAIPTDSRFRDTLRIYGYDSAGPVQVRILDESKNAIIATMQLDAVQPPDRTTFPPFAQIASLRDAFPQLAAYETVGVEIDSAFTPPAPIWAFISVTNNETQHVTIIAPQ